MCLLRWITVDSYLILRCSIVAGWANVRSQSFYAINEGSAWRNEILADRTVER
jgi:hypothetical protein